METAVLSTTLRDKTRNLLITRPANMKLHDIAATTTIPLSWLKAFASGRLNEPSVNRIETLYMFLSGNSLNI